VRISGSGGIAEVFQRSPAIRLRSRQDAALSRKKTITCAYFFLIRERMARCEGAGWKDFAERNPDLLIGKNGILSRYYREATLISDLARRVFVLPDRML
jgi:hypothetical protein